MPKSNAHRKNTKAKTGKAHVTKIILRGKATEVKDAKVPKFKYGTSRSGSNPKKAIPAGKVFPLRAYSDVLTIVRPAYFKDEDMVTGIKFRLSADGQTIKISTKGNDEKLVITRTDHPTQPWCLTVRSRHGEQFDPEYFTTPFKAYKAGLEDVWDI